MSPKLKLVIIFWWIIISLSFWVWMIIYFINAWKWWNTQNLAVDILQSWETITWSNIQQKILEKNIIENTEVKNNVDLKIEKKKHNISIYTYEWLLDKKRFNYISRKYKLSTDGTIKYLYESDLTQYYKKIKFLLAEKDDSFDIAIIPSEWYQWFEGYNQTYQLQIKGISLTSIFHYAFQDYLMKNNLKAIPFALDPIVSFINNKEIKEKNINFQELKNIILTSDRLDKQGNQQKIPILLGVDHKAAELFRKKDYYFTDIMYDIISIYYWQAIKLKDKQPIKILMTLWEDKIYKSWDSILFKKLTLKYRNWFCAKHKEYCLLFDRKTYLVPGFISDLYNISNYLDNGESVFKKDYISVVNFPMNERLDYPVRWWIMIVNPNGKNKDFVMNYFVKWFVIIWQQWKLGKLYTTLYSPFVSNNLYNKSFPILNNYLNNIVLLEDIWINQKRKLDNKLKDSFLWDYSLDLLVGEK